MNRRLYELSREYKQKAQQKIRQTKKTNTLKDFADELKGLSTDFAKGLREGMKYRR